MALFSDIDWTIIAVVAAFLLFGRDNAQTVRTLGRLYGRALRLKQELLSEVSKATDLPLGGSGGPPSLRAALLGMDPDVARASRVPAAVSRPPLLPTMPPPTPNIPWTGGSPILSWSVTGAVPSSAEGWR
jgi:hypothetical protein